MSNLITTLKRTVSFIYKNFSLEIDFFSELFRIYGVWFSFISSTFVVFRNPMKLAYLWGFYLIFVEFIDVTRSLPRFKEEREAI